MGLTPVRVTRPFRKRLRRKPPEIRNKIAKATEQLRRDHRYPGLRTHPVRSMPGVFEARLDAGNRLTFHWDGDTIVLRAHCNHDEVLRRP